MIPNEAVIAGAYALTAGTTARTLLYFSRADADLWDIAAGPGWLAGLLVVGVALAERLQWAPPSTVATSLGVHMVGLLVTACLTVWVLEDSVIARPDGIDELDERLPDWVWRAIES